MPGVRWPSGRVFPEFPEPSELTVVDLRGTDLASDRRHLALLTLQGLASREEPRLYVVLSDLDAEWLEVVRGVGVELRPASLDEAARELADCADGCVVYDPEVPDTLNVATTMAGLYRLAVVHPSDVEWARGLGLEVVEDLRGRFRSKLEAYEWAYEELWPECERRLLAPMRPEGYPRLMQVAVRDYVTALSLFAHYLNPTDPQEGELFRRLLDDMPSSSALLGWHEGTEHVTVRLASERRKFVVVTTGNPLMVANLTTWSGLRAEARFGLPPVDFSRLRPDKVYVTFYFNDGDNIQWDFMMKRFWEDPERGRVPVAWTISPFLADLAPLVAKYYAETASSRDAFVSGPSGAGYWYPSANPGYAAEHIKLSREYLRRAGLAFTEVLGEFLDGESLPRYASELGVLAVKIGYRGMDAFPYYTDRSPVPIVPGTVEFSEGEVDKAHEWLRAIATVYGRRPLHALVICVPGNFKGLRALRELAERLERDGAFELVNLHEFVATLNPEHGLELLAELLRLARRRGAPEGAVAEAEARGERARSLLKEGRWREAAVEVSKAFGALAGWWAKLRKGATVK